MGGVDINDRMAALAKSRKTKKWYCRLFRKGLMWCLFNGYIIEGYYVSHNPHGKRKRRFRQFILDVAHQLVGDFKRNSKFTSKGIVDNGKRRLSPGKHFPVVDDHRKNASCVVCSERQLRFMKANPEVSNSEIPVEHKKKKSVYSCQLCGVILCLKSGTTCWSKWHEAVDFWR